MPSGTDATTHGRVRDQEDLRMHSVAAFFACFNESSRDSSEGRDDSELMMPDGTLMG